MKRFLSCSLLSAFLLFLPVSLLAWPWSKDEKADKPMTTDESLAKQKNGFQDLLTGFSSATIELKIEVDQGRQALLTFKEAVKIATERNVEFKKVYNKWQDVESKNQFVIEKFKGLVKGAEDFYSAAESHANTIHDATLKNDALKQIQTSKDNYIARLKTTQAKLNEVSALKLKVDDTMKYLEIVQSIKVIEEKIKEAFDQIDSLIASLMKELETLKIESQNLLNSTMAESTQQQNQNSQSK